MDQDNTVIHDSTDPTLNCAMDKRTYTVREVAALLQISKSKAYELCKEDAFRIIKIGRSVRISKASFDGWLDNQI